MPAKKEYTAEFKEQSVRFVFEEIEPKESARHVVLVGPEVVGESGDALQLGEEGERRSRSSRANQILQDAAVFFGAALDRQSKK